MHNISNALELNLATPSVTIREATAVQMKIKKYTMTAANKLRFCMFSLLLSLLCLPPASAYAQDHNGQISVGAGLGLAMESPWADDTLKNAISIGPRAGLFARYHHDGPAAGLELAGDWVEFGGSSIGFKSLTISYFTRFLIDQRLQPTWSFGAGMANMENYFQSKDKTLAVFKLRAGFDFTLSTNLELGVYLDHFTIFKNYATEPNLHTVSPFITLLYSFGTPTPIANSEEKNMPTLVLEDSDADGVANKHDKCQGTPKGAKVNSLGCSSSQTIEVTVDAKFRSGSSELERPIKNMEDIVSIMKSYPDLVLLLEGHTDNRGKSSKNKKLSLARAEAIRDLLIKNGIAKNRIRCVGHGSSAPVAENSTEAGRRMNRRVNARIRTEKFQ